MKKILILILTSTFLFCFQNTVNAQTRRVNNVSGMNEYSDINSIPSTMYYKEDGFEGTLQLKSYKLTRGEAPKNLTYSGQDFEFPVYDYSKWDKSSYLMIWQYEKSYTSDRISVTVEGNPITAYLSSYKLGTSYTTYATPDMPRGADSYSDDPWIGASSCVNGNDYNTAVHFFNGRYTGSYTTMDSRMYIGIYEGEIVKPDTTAPVVTIDPSSGGWTKDSLSAVISATDNDSGIDCIYYAWTTSFSPPGSYERFPASNVYVTQNQEGIWYLWAYAKDREGNTSSPICAGQYKIDKTAPVVTINPSSGGWTSGSLGATISAADTGSGVNSIYYAWTTSSSPPNLWESVNSSTVSPSQSEEGIWYLWTYATDNVGNTSSPIYAGTYKIDKTAPYGDVTATRQDDLTMSINARNVTDGNGSGVNTVWVEYRDNTSSYPKYETLNYAGGIYTGGKNLYDLFPNALTVNVKIKASDNVGNTRTLLDSDFEAFNVKAEIVRVLDPHTPKFKCGEKGVLKINVYGGVENLKITFPTELTTRDNTLNKEINLTPKKADNVDNEFFIPLDTANNNYNASVKGYKKTKEKIVNPSFEVNGTILDELRTRIRLSNSQ